MWWLMGIGGLLGLGFIVDLIYKKKGINQIDPEENAKHVSESERVYMESTMHNIKNDHHGSSGF
ncbi:hypothetical protein [Neobacillus kokaensis]|uniref:Uncharacterized protein n=1 Tax=Neobacillus kokaensis TaxID=2759023 RepID=A0ABQ3N019_9BACI|nr:hypothetical protein [Neobacillus kokaensis]GHH96912.1 hypothetical protein AM1BK_04550 [Neobacillus kokaensis]